jgi:YbgC/YbaW family acyl-CoA thioester hydrolase
MADSVLNIRTEEEVMFFDTDCGAVVHNIAYLRFIETARTRLAVKLGMDLRQMSETQLFPVVVRTEIDYRRSAKLGDQLVIEGEIERFERARFWCRFKVVRPADDTLMVTCRQSLALVQMPEGRPVRLPEEWLESHPELGRSGNSKGRVEK